MCRIVFDKGYICNFSWSIVGASDGIQYGPFALPQNGLPIVLARKPEIEV
jgi:(+)-abscisic acid 8'-hydroxylase